MLYRHSKKTNLILLFLIANKASNTDRHTQSDEGYERYSPAKALHSNRRTLSRKLKALLDITRVEFIRRYRLQQAAVLLDQGETVS